MAVTTKDENRQIGIKMPHDLIGRLETVARREGNGISAVCRRLLSAAIQQEEKALTSAERRDR
jgi:hypothetical protein